MATIIITGASDGIGAAAAEQIADRGHQLVLVGRSPEKTAAIAGQVGAEHHVADFTELSQVRRLAQMLLDRYQRIDVLANNAGGVFDGPTRTVDGFERTFQVNHLAPLLLTHQLLDRLLTSGATVVNTASIAARIFGDIDINDLNTWGRFTSNRAYGNAKLANIISARQLHQRFHDRGLSAVAFHPGVISTNFATGSHGMMNKLYQGTLARFLGDSATGGRRLAHFITGTPGDDWQSGQYYGANLKVGRTHEQAYQTRLAERHWDLSSQMLSIRW